MGMFISRLFEAIANLSQSPIKKEAKVQWVQNEDNTFDQDGLARFARWQYYTGSFIRIEPTEGIIRKKMKRSVLSRNVDLTTDNDSQRKPLVYNEDLIIRVCVNSYKIMYQEFGSEYFIYTDKSMTGPEVLEHGEVSGSTGDAPVVSAARERLREVENRRTSTFKDKFERNPRWMKNLSHDQVAKVNEEFKAFVNDGAPAPRVPNRFADVEMH
jgi:paired amphipathic helix protein Sin3a